MLFISIKNFIPISVYGFYIPGFLLKILFFSSDQTDLCRTFFPFFFTESVPLQAKLSAGVMYDNCTDPPKPWPRLSAHFTQRDGKKNLSYLLLGQI